MNQHLRDNTAASVWQYMLRSLQTIYEQREAAHIASALFRAYKGWDRAQVVMFGKETFSESELLDFHYALKRLLRHEPLQYILGNTWFFGLSIEVNPSVLIPRPETEELVKHIIDKHSQSSTLRILDIGTGSGCIAIALARHLPHAEVYAIDISAEALEVARHNAKSNNVDVHFFEQDILTSIPEGRFDIVVSNPPYVLESDKSRMERSVLDHEPHLALFVADSDPLLYYRRIISLLPTLSLPNCHIYFEIHENLAHLFEEWPEAKIVADMQGKNRFVLFQGKE